MKIYFSVNDYDYEGDVIEKNIRLHFQGTMEDFNDFIASLQNMREELENAYNDRNSEANEQSNR